MSTEQQNTKLTTKAILNPAICEKCKLNIVGSIDPINCGFCKSSFHPGCAKKIMPWLTQSTVDVACGSGVDLVFKCHVCLIGAASPIADMEVLQVPEHDGDNRSNASDELDNYVVLELNESEIDDISSAQSNSPFEDLISGSKLSSEIKENCLPKLVNMNTDAASSDEKIDDSENVVAVTSENNADNCPLKEEDKVSELFSQGERGEVLLKQDGNIWKALYTQRVDLVEEFEETSVSNSPLPKSPDSSFCHKNVDVTEGFVDEKSGNKARSFYFVLGISSLVGKTRKFNMTSRIIEKLTPKQDAASTSKETSCKERSDNEQVKMSGPKLTCCSSLKIEICKICKFKLNSCGNQMKCKVCKDSFHRDCARKGMPWVPQTINISHDTCSECIFMPAAEHALPKRKVTLSTKIIAPFENEVESIEFFTQPVKNTLPQVSDANSKIASCIQKLDDLETLVLVSPANIVNARSLTGNKLPEYNLTSNETKVVAMPKRGAKASSEVASAPGNVDNAKAHLHDIYSEHLPPALERIVSNLNATAARLEEQRLRMSEEVLSKLEDMSSKMHSWAKKVDELESFAKKKILQLENKNNRLHCFMNRADIIIKGIPPAVKSDKLRDIVIAIGDVYGVTLTPFHIKVCCRMQRQAAVLAKFNNVAERDLIMKKYFKDLKLKLCQIYNTDDVVSRVYLDNNYTPVVAKMSVFDFHHSARDVHDTLIVHRLNN
ncbi:hypothetical protein GQX74_006696 [Glossina fuscipes]|nr:hypothetical protein GQX74_006696 [Glossina fuscipes]